MTKVCASLLFVVVLATACSTPRTASLGRFTEQDQANLVVRYYTDDTSYVLKPEAKDGRFLSVLNKNAVLEVAKQQTQRELAVVVLIHYGTESQADVVKKEWSTRLTDAGYQRVVFLLGRGKMQVNGLPVLANGG